MRLYHRRLRHHCVFVWALALLLAASVRGQSPRLALSGEWTERPGTAVPPAVDVFCGTHCRLELGDTSLKITRLDLTRKDQLLIKWDGSEVANKLETKTGIVELWSSAKWVDDRLIISTRIQRGALRSQSTVTITMDAGTLVVERQARGTAAPAVDRRQLYERKR